MGEGSDGENGVERDQAEPQQCWVLPPQFTETVRKVRVPSVPGKWYPGKQMARQACPLADQSPAVRLTFLGGLGWSVQRGCGHDSYSPCHHDFPLLLDQGCSAWCISFFWLHRSLVPPPLPASQVSKGQGLVNTGDSCLVNLRHVQDIHSSHSCLHAFQ